MQSQASQSQSPSSIPATQKRVQQKVFGPGVTKNRKSTQASQSTTPTKKKSTVNTQRKKAAAAIHFDEIPNLDLDSIYWVTPAPGYGNPLNLSTIPENSGKIFMRWLSWESNDRVGYTLYDKDEVKYWADAASIHMLTQAKLAGIDYDFFQFAVYRQGKEYKYGFVPRAYIPREKLVTFEHYKSENQKLGEAGNYIAKPIVIKGEEEEEEEAHEEEEEDQLPTADAAGNNEENTIELD